MTRTVAEEIACRYRQLWSAILQSDHKVSGGSVVETMQECIEEIYKHFSDLNLSSRSEIIEMNRTKHHSASQQMYPERDTGHRSGTGSHESRELSDKSSRDGASILSRCSKIGSTTQKLKTSLGGTRETRTNSILEGIDGAL